MMGLFRTLLHIFLGKEYIILRRYETLNIKRVNKIGQNYYVYWEYSKYLQLLPNGKTNSTDPYEHHVWEALTDWGDKYYNSKKTSLQKSLDETKSLLDSV